MNYCVNCKWVRGDDEFSKCTRFADRSPVTGEPTILYCNVARLSHGACGTDGRGFEPVEVSHGE